MLTLLLMSYLSFINFWFNIYGTYLVKTLYLDAFLFMFSFLLTNISDLCLFEI